MTLLLNVIYDGFRFTPGGQEQASSPAQSSTEAVPNSPGRLRQLRNAFRKRLDRVFQRPHTIQQPGDALRVLAEGSDTPTQRFRDQAASVHAITEAQSQTALLDNAHPGAWKENRPLDEVEKSLPIFHGLSLTEIISEFPHPVVWDLGSGDRAVALSQLIAKNPKLDITGIGVTLPVERPGLIHPENVTVIR